MSGKLSQNQSLLKKIGPKLGEGSYGCIYKSANDSNEVIKISEHKDADIELDIGNIIRTIPNWQEYFIIQEKEDFNTSNITRIRPYYAHNCKIIRESTNSDLRVLSSPYGGVSVRSITVTESFQYMKTIQHLIEAVSKLNDQGICHFDLHSGNILEDINGTFRIIDFGASFLGDMADVETVKKRNYTFSPTFASQPPELAVQNGIMHKKLISDCVKEVVMKRKVFTNSYVYTGLTPSYAEDELLRFCRSEKHSNMIQWAEYYRKYWRKWDMWSVGIIALQLFQQSMLIPSQYIELWKDEKNRVKIQNLLKGCLEPDPTKRFTAKEALLAWISS